MSPHAVTTVITPSLLTLCLVFVYLSFSYAANNYNNHYNSYYGQQNSWYDQNTIELPPGRSNGCTVKGLCCEGKNNTCMAKGPRMNDADSELCFCDSPCRQLGDCCTDYDNYCTGKG